MLPDRYFFTEHFEWPSKKFMLDLISKHKKNGVLFLSGDVHFAQFYHMNCESVVGYNLTEMTTSGLTHHAAGLLPISNYVMDFTTPLFWNVIYQT